MAKKKQPKSKWTARQTVGDRLLYAFAHGDSVQSLTWLAPDDDIGAAAGFFAGHGLELHVKLFDGGIATFLDPLQIERAT